MGENLFDLAKAVATYWAFWACVFGIVFILVFRNPVAEFIRRLTRVGRGNWTAEAPEQKSPEQKPFIAPLTETLPQAGDKSDPRKAADELIAVIARNEYINFVEENIKKALAERGLTAGSGDAYRVLTLYVSSALVTAHFEQLYNIIWTSQIQILTQANSSADGLTREEIRHYYEAGARLAPTTYSTYSFDQYLLFLTGQELLIETPRLRYAITKKGRTFLLYIIHEGKSQARWIY